MKNFTIKPVVPTRAEHLAIWQAYLSLHATLMQVLETQLQAEQALPLLWYETLVHLNQAPQGALRLQDLATAIHLSQSGLTRLLDRMAAAELLQRRPCAQDRRGLYAEITAAGQVRLAQAQPVYWQVLEAHFFRYLSDEEVQMLHKILSHLGQMEPGLASAIQTKADQSKTHH